MAPVLAPIIAAAIPATATAVVGSVTAAAIIADVVILAAVVGAQYALASRNAEASRESYQSAVRQASGPRFRAYGLVKTSGVVYFYEARNAIFCQGLALGSGEIDAVESVWIDGSQVTIAVSDAVTSGNLAGYASVHTKLGAADQVTGPIIAAFFSDVWTSNHRLRGIPILEMSISRPGDRALRSVLPRGIPEDIRVIMRGAKVYDPREVSHSATTSSTWEWSENPALCLLDYLRHADGGRVPLSWINVDTFETAADTCDVLVEAPGDTTEPRYRLGGIYAFDEEARRVIGRMLATMDGELYLDGDGKIALRLGGYVEPTVTFTDEHIVEIRHSAGLSALTGINEVRTKFTDRDNDYQLVDGPVLQDTALITAAGRVNTEELAFPMVPSGSQAHRLGYRYLKRKTPASTVQMTVDVYGLMAIGESVVRVTSEAMDLNGVFQVVSMEVAEDLASVSLSLVQVTEATFTEVYPEVDPSRPVDPVDPEDIEVPSGVTVAAIFEVSGLGSVAKLELAASAPTDTTLVLEAQHRQSGTTSWIDYAEALDGYVLRSSVITEGIVYESRARFVDPAGRESEWSSTVETTAAVDPVAPGQASSLSLSELSGVVTVAWTNTSSSNLAWTEVRRSTTSTFGDSVRVAIVLEEASSAVSVDDEPGTPDTYYYWVRSFNASGLSSAEVGPESITV